MQGSWNCVYLSKIKNSSYHREIVSHPMSDNIDELSGKGRIKLQQRYLDNYVLAKQVPPVSRFFPLVFKSTLVFFIIDDYF